MPVSANTYAKQIMSCTYVAIFSPQQQASHHAKAGTTPSHKSRMKREFLTCFRSCSTKTERGFRVIVTRDIYFELAQGQVSTQQAAQTESESLREVISSLSAAPMHVYSRILPVLHLCCLSVPSQEGLARGDQRVLPSWPGFHSAASGRKLDMRGGGLAARTSLATGDC